jgi:hypothetical protein
VDAVENGDQPDPRALALAAQLNHRPLTDQERTALEFFDSINPPTSEVDE